jgi:hypothetical protein
MQLASQESIEAIAESRNYEEHERPKITALD